MTEEAPVANEVTGAETTISNTDPVETAPAVTPDFNAFIPEEFADRPWVQDVKDIHGFFKMADDMKSEMGKRADAVPSAPDSIEGYEMETAEGQEDFHKAIKEMYLKNGVSAEMAKGLDGDFNEIIKSLSPDQEASDKEFDEMTDKLFGDRADAVMKTTKSLLSENTPEGYADHVNDLDNKTMTVLAAVLDNVQSKYINEDSLPRDTGGVGPGMSVEEKRSEAKKIYATPEYQSKTHPGHAAAMAKISKLYEGIS